LKLLLLKVMSGQLTVKFARHHWRQRLALELRRHELGAGLSRLMVIEFEIEQTQTGSIVVGAQLDITRQGAASFRLAPHALFQVIQPIMGLGAIGRRRDRSPQQGQNVQRGAPRIRPADQMALMPGEVDQPQTHLRLARDWPGFRLGLG
jgi:hypothetical protein